MKLVLLPGLDGTGRLFEAFVKALPAIDHHVIDYPPNVTMDYDGHVRHARERLPRNEPYVLLGESFSGPVALSLAASRPEHLRGLILCCSFASNPLPALGWLRRVIAAAPAIEPPFAIAAQFLYGRWLTPPLRKNHAEVMASISPATLQARLLAVLGLNVRDRLRDVTVPMLYLQARSDRLVPAGALRRMLDVRPDLEVRVFDGPHCLLQARPMETSAAVAAFMHQL